MKTIKYFLQFISIIILFSFFKILGLNISSAIGGKLLGAGGGGFFLFYVTPFRRQKVVKKLESLNLNIYRFTFDDLGLQSWKTRVDK